MKKLSQAVKPFISRNMQRHTEDLPNDTPVRLEIPGRNGYVLTVTLKELRKLWAEAKE